MIVFAHTITPRLQYILDFIGKETIGKPFQGVSDIETFRNYTGPKINYSNEKITESEFRIQNTELLFQKGYQEQSILDTGSEEGAIQSPGRATKGRNKIYPY